MLRKTLLPILLLLTLASPSARGSEPPRGLDELGAIAVQDGGRVMPLEAYARRLAVQLTGRQHWSGSRGPEAFADRTPMQLFCDLMFTGPQMLRRPLIVVDNKPFKRLVGLDPETRFFTAVELASNKGILELMSAYDQARQANPDAQPTHDQRSALDIRDAVDRVVALVQGQPLGLVPAAAGGAFLKAGPAGGDPGAERVAQAFAALKQAYAAGGPVEPQVQDLRRAIESVGSLEPAQARSVRLEMFYDRHDPWLWTAVLYGLSVVLFGLSRLVFRRPLTILAIVTAATGVAEHLLGVGLRVAILGRAPVSNTYEALLWMGLVAIAIGLTAQLFNRKGWYLFAGVCAALVSVLFAGLVPLGDRTNVLPAVLRSNFWLTIHVLTIVASYGVLTVASVLGHAYLTKEVILARRGAKPATGAGAPSPLITQIYRTIQVGLVLLTAGTILGGVWAAESWGRFWGWDPKETWALISILTYFAVLHARYVRWIEDFGLATAAVLGFVVIVWTFYGVNYVMGTGLHSYGFGSGGEFWVGVWAVAEIVFVVIARLRFLSIRRSARNAASTLTRTVAHPSA